MVAIRTEHNDIAEYLIDQLAINVQYKAEMSEFRLNRLKPLRYRTYSCRDLAYKKGMMTLVDLIDFLSEDIKPGTRRHLKQRLQTRLELMHEKYLKRLTMCDNHRFNHDPSSFDIDDEQPMIDTSTESNSHRHSYVIQSSVQEQIHHLFTTNVRSIDEIERKKFRFSNYTLNFQLDKSGQFDNKSLSRAKSTVPSMPTIPSVNSRLSTIVNDRQRSSRQCQPRLPVRHTRTSICRSAQTHRTSSIVWNQNRTHSIDLNTRVLTQRQPMKQTNYALVFNNRDQLICC
jgi:hypothetical protein